MKKRITTAIVTSAIAGTMMVTPAFAANTESAHTDLSLYIANDHLMQKNIHKFRLQPAMYNIFQKARKFL